MFDIGSKPGLEYPGVSKLVEETGELLQVIGKLMATGDSPEHWSGADLRQEFVIELADVHAALSFVSQHVLSPDEVARMILRSQQKLARLAEWQEAQEHVRKVEAEQVAQSVRLLDAGERACIFSAVQSAYDRAKMEMPKELVDAIERVSDNGGFRTVHG